MTTSEFRVHLSGIAAALGVLSQAARGPQAPPVDEITATVLERLDEADQLLADALAEVPEDAEDVPGLTNMAAQDFVEGEPRASARLGRGPLIR